MGSPSRFYLRYRRQLKALKPRDAIQTWKIIRGDTVRVCEGRERGKEGTVAQVLREKNKVVVAGVNLPNYVTQEVPIHYSNVQIIDPVTKKAVRVGFKFTEDGEKVRVTRGRNSSQSVLPKSSVLFETQTRDPGLKDTPASHVQEKTFRPGQPITILPRE